MTDVWSSEGGSVNALRYGDVCFTPQDDGTYDVFYRHAEGTPNERPFFGYVRRSYGNLLLLDESGNLVVEYGSLSQIAEYLRRLYEDGEA